MTEMELPSLDKRIHVLSVSSLGEGPVYQTFLSRLDDTNASEDLKTLTGHEGLDPNGAEVFALKDIEAIGLSTYLAEAYDIPKSTLAQDAAKLNALAGDVVVLSPKAIGRKAVMLRLDPILTHVGSYLPKQPDNSPRAVPSLDMAPAHPDTSMVAKSQTTVPFWLKAVLVICLAVAALWMLA